MFNVGGGEIMVILLLALLVLGPDKLPEYARKAGNYFHEFRRMTSGFEEEFRQAMDLGDVGSSPATKTPAAADPSSGDALERATEGPRLLPVAEEPTAPPLPEPPAPPAATDQAPASDPAPSTTSSPEHAAPAPGSGPELVTGPELITPARPPERKGDPGSSSAA